KTVQALSSPAPRRRQSLPGDTLRRSGAPHASRSSPCPRAATDAQTPPATAPPRRTDPVPAANRQAARRLPRSPGVLPLRPAPRELPGPAPSARGNERATAPPDDTTTASPKPRAPPAPPRHGDLPWPRDRPARGAPTASGRGHRRGAATDGPLQNLAGNPRHALAAKASVIGARRPPHAARPARASISTPPKVRACPQDSER